MAKKEMIYQIFHFKDRYEYDDSGHIDRFRVGPLKYIKTPVGCGEVDETVSYYRQMQALKGYKNYDTLHTVYYELLELSACQSLAYRGYIVDGAYKPANITTIARLINRDVIIARKAISILLEIGLIEYVPAPVFKPLKKLRRKFPAQTGNQPARTGKTPPTHSRTGNSEQSNNKRLTAKRLTAEDEKKNKTANSRNDKAEAENKSRSRKAIKTLKAEISQDKPQNKAEAVKPDSKANTRSKRCQEAQSANKKPVPQADEAAPKPTSPEANTEHYGASVASGKADIPLIRNEQDFERYAKTLAPAEVKFGLEIYRRLRCSSDYGDPHGWPGCRQYITFTNAMRRALIAGLSANEIDRMSQAAFKEADKKGRQRHTKPWRVSCEAAWMDKFNKRLLARIADNKQIFRDRNTGLIVDVK